MNTPPNENSNECSSVSEENKDPNHINLKVVSNVYIYTGRERNTIQDQ